MAEIYKFERCEFENDPRRCQGLAHKGGQQCPFKAVDGFSYCARHASNKQRQSLRVASTRIYRLQEWKNEVERQADHPDLKSLREELGILRVTLQTQMNRCKTEDDLMMRAGAITEMVREITKTARVCHALELSVGTVLDKQQAIQWVLEIGQILGTYLQDSDILEMIAADILESLERRTDAQKAQARNGEEIHQSQALLEQ